MLVVFIPLWYSLLCKPEAFNTDISIVQSACSAHGVWQKVCVLDGSRAWGVPAVGTSWWMGRGRVLQKGRIHSQGAASARCLIADWSIKLEFGIEIKTEHGLRCSFGCSEVLNLRSTGFSRVNYFSAQTEHRLIDSKPDVHLKTCSCLGHRAKTQLQFAKSLLTEITSASVLCNNRHYPR